MVTIAVVSHKGGAGKTTVAINLGAAIAARGRRVLLVDCDPQGSLAAALAVPADKPCLFDVLDGRARASDAVRPTAVDGLDVLPADIDLAGTEAELSSRSGGTGCCATPSPRSTATMSHCSTRRRASALSPL